MTIPTLLHFEALLMSLSDPKAVAPKTLPAVGSAATTLEAKRCRRFWRVWKIIGLYYKKITVF